MKILCQQTLPDLRVIGFVDQFDSKDWNQVPDELVGNAFVCQGNIFTGYDHVAVIHRPDGGCEICEWKDDNSIARVTVLLPYAPDPLLNGAINTRVSKTVYAEPILLANLRKWAPAERTDLLPIENFQPPAGAKVVNGIWQTDGYHQALFEAQQLEDVGWRTWGESGLGAGPPVPMQRPLGRYRHSPGTKTFFKTNDARTNTLDGATDEVASEEAADSGTLSEAVSGGADEIIMVWTSPVGAPSSAWPTDVAGQLDINAVGADISCGFRLAGSSGTGHIARVVTGLGSHVDTKQMAEGLFSSAGIKAYTVSGAWAAGDDTNDRLEALLGATRAASMGGQSVRVNTDADSFTDGGWVAGQTFEESFSLEGSGDTVFAAGNVMEAAPSNLAGQANHVYTPGLDIPVSVADLAVQADQIYARDVTLDLAMVNLAARAGLTPSEFVAFNPAFALAGSAGVAVAAQAIFEAIMANLAGRTDILLAVNNVIEAVLTDIAGQADQVYDRGLDIQESLSFGATASIALAAVVTFNAVMANLAAQANLVLANDIVMEVAPANFAVQADIGLAAELVIDVSVTTLASQAGLTVAPNLVIDVSITLAGQGGQAYSVDVAFNLTLGLDAQADIAAAAGLIFNAVLTLSTQAGLTPAAQADLLTALTLGLSTAILTVGQVPQTFEESLNFTVKMGINAEGEYLYVNVVYIGPAQEPFTDRAGSATSPYTDRVGTADPTDTDV